MSYCYIFDDENTALSAERYICEIGRVPLSGVNAKTGELNTDYERFTVKWATPKELINGKWAFTLVPQIIRDNYPLSATNYFNTTFPNTIEEIPLSGFVGYVNEDSLYV